MKIKLLLTIAVLLIAGSSVLAQTGAGGSGQAAKQAGGEAGGPATKAGGPVPKMKVAIVDAQAFKERLGELKVKYDKLVAEFQGRSQQLQSMQAKLEAQSKTLQEGKNLTPQQAQKLNEDIEEQKKLYNRTLEDSQGLARKRETEETDAVYEKVQKFLNQYCTKNGITHLFDLSRLQETRLVLHMADAANITEDFIKEYNKANPSTAPAASTAKP
jgi:Skp family chaperone for outer membrane proteins